MNDLRELERMLERAGVDHHIVHRRTFERGYTPGGKVVEPTEVFSVIYVQASSELAFIFDEDDFLFTVEDNSI